MVAAKRGTSLLGIAERADLKPEVGCRMGVCGTSLVHVVEGADNLTPITKDEAYSLERLGLGGSNRMACCTRVEGPCRVSLEPDRPSVAAARAAAFVV